MAEFDIKAASPDTSLPSTGFLFGADSQASANPSIYSTQTVATALLGSTSLTGATETTSKPLLDLSQTWNAGGVTFTGWKLNVTNTASAAASLLMDLQVGGTTAFNVNRSGTATFGANSNSVRSLIFTTANIGNEGFSATANEISLWANGSSSFAWNANSYRVGSNTEISWTSTASPIAQSGDLYLTRRAAANLRLGLADAAAPIAQTLSVQSVVAGTSNTAGTNFTIAGSQGTGTGAGGSLIFQVAPAGSSGSAVNALSTALTIAGTLNAQFAGNVGIKTAPVSARELIVSGFGTATSGWLAGTSGSQNAAVLPSGIVSVSSAFQIYTGDAVGGTLWVNLAADAANTLALKNSTNAQEFRVYETTTGPIYKAILGNRQLMKISGAAFDNGAGASAGTLTNSPAAGNPTKWIPIDDNGTTRYIPAW